MIPHDELYKMESAKVERMYDALIEIRKLMRDPEIYSNKEKMLTLVSKSMALRGLSSSFTQTARIITIDEGWDDIG